jgi:hypothetical protein
LTYAVYRKEAKVMRAQTEGRIICSKVVESIEKEREILSDTPLEDKADDDLSDYMLICWEFTANGRRYRGRSPRVSGLIADWVLKRYPIGRRVKVHYDPQDPTKSTIEGLEFHIWSPVALLIFLFVGLPLILLQVFYLSPSIFTFGR